MATVLPSCLALIIQKKKPTLHTGNLRHFAKNTAGVLGEH
jgi:hypothetical protein